MRYLLLITLCLLPACQLPKDPPPGATGAEIYTLQLCFNCHGDQGEGKDLGPPLRDLSQSWTRDELADFLGDTERWEEEDERVYQLSQEYDGNMRGYWNLELDERLRLADWLLSL